jgi:UDP-N-acetylglucosamine 1-carboxyvinyltransferase
MPARLVIEGGTPLRGEVQVSAAKNAALPAMAASLLTAQPVMLENVPALADVVTMHKLLEKLGAETSVGPGGATRLRYNVASHGAPYELVSAMRASVVVLGPLLGRVAHCAARQLPSACAPSARGLARLGTDIVIEQVHQLTSQLRPDHHDLVTVMAQNLDVRRAR